MTRCYAAAQLPVVRGWRDAGAVPGGTPATAVTAGVRRALPDADDEERENAAALAAVDITSPAGGAVPVVVVAVDADDVRPLDDDGAGVLLGTAVPVHRWVALFLVVEADDEPELAWYAVDEIDAMG